MKTLMKPLAVALTAGAMIVAPTAAEARSGGVVGGVAVQHGAPSGHRGGPGHGGWHGGGWHGGGWRGGPWYGGYWGPGPFWGGLGLGLGIGAIAYYGAYDGYGGYYAYPQYVVPGSAEYIVVEPPPGDRVVRSSGQPVPSTPSAPDPIFYPRNGQTAAKTEADRQECNRWATTQNGAMSDASIFQRATFACMEGRGYTVR